MLNNERYMGDALLQKKYTTDTLPFKKVKNRGERPKYYVENANPAIVSRETYAAVQELQKSRQKNMSGKKTSYPLTGMLRCPDCGRTYRRQLVRGKAYWMCSGRASGATICFSQRMSESDVYEAFNKMLFKLKEHHHAILGALLRDIEIMQSKTSENHEKIAEIDKEIADLAARNLVIVRLHTSGMINNGERPKYYVENNHPAIIDSGTFGRVQEEMARRGGKRKVKQVGTKTEQGRYSSKYALTELLICGECGTPYRRCTWAANGKKKVVWRCINRLDYGKKYCHDSPSVEESVLQEAIMNAVLQTAKQNAEVLKTLKLHIGMGLSAETTEDNSLDLQIRIAEIETEFQKMLKDIAADNVEAFDEEKAKALMDEKAKLQIQLDRIADTKQKRENAKSRLDEIFTIIEALVNHPISYDDQIVRQILESVIIESKDRIKVVFIGGLEVTQLL